MHAVEQRTEAPAAPVPRVPERLVPDPVADVLRSPGRPLGGAVRASMESAFGADLGDVRVHSDAPAARSAAALGARAWTVGPHVVLGRDAGDADATHTLAHEIAHVVQQRGAPTAGPLPVSRAGDAAELAADAAADRVVSGRRATGLARTSRRQVSRQVPHTGQTQNVAPPRVIAGPTDAAGAAALVTLELFDSDGFFAAVREVLQQFQTDMTTQLGWYAGSQTQPVPVHGLAGQIAIGAATELAKSTGKSALTVLVEGLSGGMVAAGPAGAVAGYLLSAITTSLADMDSYRPVVTAEAQKPAHQVLIESIRDVLRRGQEDLRQNWTAQITAATRDLGVGGLMQYVQKIRDARDAVRRSFYLELVTAYLQLGTGGQAVELETPHAYYTGVGKGFKLGSPARTWVETIAPDEVYVEFAASGYANADFRVIRTVVPRLPSTVLAQLNANPDPQATLGNLPRRRIVAEGQTPIGPAKLWWDFATGRVGAEPIPHFSRMFALNVAQAAGNRTNWTTGGDMSSGELNGTTLFFTWLITQPLNRLHFSA